jgi:methyl coenzyme M reductase gamma subunit
MRKLQNMNIENWKVTEVVENIAGAKDVLHTRNIDPVARMSFANAAAAVGENTEVLKAVMNHRMRRAARVAQPATAEARTENELVA